MTATAWHVDAAAGPYEGGLAGVAWDGAGVVFSAPRREELLRLEGATVSVWRRYAAHVHGLALGPNGTLYGAQTASRRIVEYRDDGTTHVVADRLDGRIHNNPNALAVDAGGDIWFTDPVLPIEAPGPRMHPPLPHASVLRIHRLGNRGVELQRATYDTVSPTAIGISSDGGTLYVSDNPPDASGVRELRAYTIEPDGALGPPVVLHTFGHDLRGPHAGVQGLCTSDDGMVVACAGSRASGPGPMLYVFDPSGRVMATHRMEDEPVSCCFGDEDLRSLYVTTRAGWLLRVRGTGLRGAGIMRRRLGERAGSTAPS